MAQRRKEFKARPRIAQVRFLNYMGNTPEEIFTEGFERAQAGFSLETVVRFFDVGNTLTNLVLSHTRMLESQEKSFLALKKARAERKGKAEIQRLKREMTSISGGVTNSRKRIHSSVVKVLEGVVARNDVIALQDEDSGKTRELSRDEFFDLVSMAKLSRHVHVEIFSPSYLLCRRENLTVYTSTD